MRRFFDKIFSDSTDTDPTSDESLRLAVVALLFEAIGVDGAHSPEEEETVCRIVTNQFDLTPDETDALLDMAYAAAENASDLYGRIKIINQHYSHDEKLSLLEKLWQVILADGVIDSHESALMRRIAGLIYVSDAASAEARRRVIARD